MSHYTLDGPCPDCGSQVYALDLRGKWRYSGKHKDYHGCYYCFRCIHCKHCWIDEALTQRIREPECMRGQV